MEKQKLFVGNLNFETTEDEVKQLFSEYGTVKEIRMRQKKRNRFR
jgi:RNA recognition motif-containing protein